MPFPDVLPLSENMNDFAPLVDVKSDVSAARLDIIKGQSLYPSSIVKNVLTV